MAVFVSYARQDRDTVGALCNDLELLGRQVWIDERLRGGQEWWDEILDQIRTCDVFVWTVSPTSVQSKACRSELEYAAALGRPILPVKIKDVALALAPQRIANAQVTDYSERDVNQALRLAGDLQALPTPNALPDPLPAPPQVPITYLDTFADEVASMTPIAPTRQREIVEFLRPVATDAENSEDADAARRLLTKMKARPEITLESATAIDAIVNASVAPAPQPVAAAAPTAQSFTPSPPPQSPPPQSTWQQPPQAPAAPAGSEPWSGGVFTALLAATIFCGGIIGVIVGLLHRKDSAKRGQANALLWIGVAVLVLSIVIALASVAAEEAGCDPTIEFC
jgi:hypothetical protein